MSLIDGKVQKSISLLSHFQKWLSCYYHVITRPEKLFNNPFLGGLYMTFARVLIKLLDRKRYYWTELTVPHYVNTAKKILFRPLLFYSSHAKTTVFSIIYPSSLQFELFWPSPKLDSTCPMRTMIFLFLFGIKQTILNISRDLNSFLLLWAISSLCYECVSFYFGRAYSITKCRSWARAP